MGSSKGERRAVLRGMALAWGLSLTVLPALIYVFRMLRLDEERVLAVAVLAPALALALGIGRAAQLRFFGVGIDGGEPEVGSPLDIAVRYVQNTTEQVILLVLAFFAIILLFTKDAPPVLAALAVWFLVARLVFWIGYSRSPLCRAVGFAATFHVTAAVLVICLGKLIIG